MWLLAALVLTGLVAAAALTQRALSARAQAQRATAVHHAVQTVATANLEAMAGLAVDRDALDDSVQLLTRTQADGIPGLSPQAGPQADRLLEDAVRTGSSLLDQTSAGRDLSDHEDLMRILETTAASASDRVRTTTMGALLSAAAAVAALLVALTTSMRRRTRRLRASANSDEQRRAQHRLRSLLSDTNEIVLVISPSGEIVHRSRTADRLLSPSATTVDDLVACAVPDDAQALRRHLHRTDTYGAARAFPLITATGGNEWFELRVSDFSGNELIGGRVITIRNVNDEMTFQEPHGRLHIDPLTGLPDRRMLDATLHQATAVMHMHQSLIALMIIDIDGFKRINGAMGIEQGDRTLRRIANRLRLALAPGETLLRLGGDEFSVILPGLTSPAVARDRGRALLNALNGPQVSAADAVRASIGIAVTDAPTPTGTLLSHADYAMNRAKRQSGNTVVLYQQDPASQSSRTMEILRALRDADYESEFSLVYQPIVASDSRRVVAIEALLRWTSPTVGTVEPDEFIPLAEESGQISAIGQLVIDRVCRQLTIWHAAGVSPTIPTTINVSAHQLAEPDFCTNLLDRLVQSSLRPSQIVVEVAESAMFDRNGRVVAGVHALRAAGVKVWIDDFGSGYCNIGELLRTPVDTIKIDHSLLATSPQTHEQAGVETPELPSILASVVTVARTLGSPIVSEGVETELQRLSLERSGVDFFQGYLFGRPVPADELTSTLITISRLHPHDAEACEPTGGRPAR